ncbi:hypothetical protein DPMN_104087 [Dreissena polymorpha]|uniref:C3H1-type domain-containing protein n=1 Tax=Dreissena polymorpha TaxID=45954 RepID=A0A9D4H9P9_DREPO|nr:hypothetical protein DPMN_104087 [Dreissena polymorpha]
MTYKTNVRDLAQKRPGLAFYVCDQQFRMVRENGFHPWDSLHLDYWLLVSTKAPTTSPFPSAQSGGNNFRFPRQPFHATNYSSNQSYKPNKFHMSTCWTFNMQSECMNNACPHKHICGYCKCDHPATRCSFSSIEQVRATNRSQTPKVNTTNKLVR